MATATVQSPDTIRAGQLTQEHARAELAKFFAIAAVEGENPGMFSRFIDAEWHRLAQTIEYPRFCRDTAGTLVTHDPTCGEGTVSWLDLYHERFGPLPAAWFADETGQVDVDAFRAYRDSGTVVASWNCSADTGDGDGFTTDGNP